jgi:hypothetical protein
MRPPLRAPAASGFAVIALLAGGCGTQHQPAHTSTYGQDTQLVQNNAPDGGAPTIGNALTRLRAALQHDNAAELCRLFAYVPRTNCISDWRPVYKRIGPVTTRIVSIQGTAQNTIVVLDSAYRLGRRHITRKGQLALAQQHGRWFIGDLAN